MRRLITATIRKCGSQWCLYTKDGSRLLGKHESKEKALAQERAIKARQAGACMVRVLDEVAATLEARGARRLARLVDAQTGQLLTQRQTVLDDTGFRNIMQRQEDAADELFENPIKPVDPTDGIAVY